MKATFKLDKLFLRIFFRNVCTHGHELSHTASPESETLAHGNDEEQEQANAETLGTTLLTSVERYKFRPRRGFSDPNVELDEMTVDEDFSAHDPNELQFIPNDIEMDFIFNQNGNNITENNILQNLPTVSL